MGQISDMQTRDCLVWVTERPIRDVPRKSSNFWLLGYECYFQLIVNSYGEYEITLQDFPMLLNSDFSVTTFVSGETRRSCTWARSGECGQRKQTDSEVCYGLTVWCCETSKADKALGSDLRQGRWTATFIFHDSCPLMLHVSRSEKDLSVDKCVQAELNIPPDLESLSGDISQLLKREIFPDVKLRCGDRNISAHRSILAARSEVFTAMFQNKMAESETGTVDVTDIDSEVLDLLLQYVYSGKIPDLSYDTASSLYEAGDKYSIHALKKSCSDWMVRNLTADNCLGYLLVADAHSDEEFKERVVDFAAENLESIKRDDWFKFNKDYAWLGISVYHKRFASTLAKQT